MWKINILNRLRYPKILCLIVHYFGDESQFKGKSTDSANKARKKHLLSVVKQLRTFPRTDIRLCGIPGHSLLPLDREFTKIGDPQLLVYETLWSLFDNIDDYDYFMVIEDDILAPRSVVDNIIEFDKVNEVDECLHPNRLEVKEGKKHCVDLLAMPGWTDMSKLYKGHELRVAVNPHSAFLFLSREKLLYLRRHIDKEYRDRFIGGYMASAFAYFHRPFKLYRVYNNLEFHTIEHLDHWMG
jgi:hypothetical protein